MPLRSCGDSEYPQLTLYREPELLMLTVTVDKIVEAAKGAKRDNKTKKRGRPHAAAE